MWPFIDKIPYSILIVAAVLMILAPFKPMPHANAARIGKADHAEKRHVNQTD